MHAGDGANNPPRFDAACFSAVDAFAAAA